MTDPFFAQLLPFQPAPMAGLKALLLSVLLSSGLAILSLWPDIVALSAILIGLSALALPVIYGGTSRSMILRLVLGLLGGALGLACLWGLRFGLEFSWAGMLDVAQQGPMAFIERFTETSDRFQIATDRSNGGGSQGPSTVMMAWMAGTAIIGLMPVLGALQGPKAIQALRGMKARRSGSNT